MLRMYFLQQWYTLADEALEDALYDSQAMREFIGIDLGREDVPSYLLPPWQSPWSQLGQRFTPSKRSVMVPVQDLLPRRGPVTNPTERSALRARARHYWNKSAQGVRLASRKVLGVRGRSLFAVPVSSASASSSRSACPTRSSYEAQELLSNIVRTK
jgi:hypothetical protein